MINSDASLDYFGLQYVLIKKKKRNIAIVGISNLLKVSMKIKNQNQDNEYQMSPEVIPKASFKIMKCDT